MNADQIILTPDTFTYDVDMSGPTIRVDGGKAYTMDEVADIIRWWQAEDR